MHLPTGSGPYILYADDDPDDLMLVWEALKEIDSSLVMLGHSNGKAAFDFLESVPEGALLPCLIILDMNMPVWNGIETLQTIKKHKQYQRVPVCIFTNSDHPQHHAESLSKGAVDFITKPYRNADLLKICGRFAAYRNDVVRFK